MNKIKDYVKNYLKEVDENGFSLLELVVAVGILLVLTVGGLLAYNGLTRNARVAAVQSAADEVYTGAVAYDSNGQDYKDAEKEWTETRNGASIVVKAWKDTTGAICAEAEMESYDIAVKRGAGCDGVPADTGGTEIGGGSENDDENDEVVIEHTTNISVHQGVQWLSDLSPLTEVNWNGYNPSYHPLFGYTGLPDMFKIVNGNPLVPNPNPDLACSDKYDYCGARLIMFDAVSGEELVVEEDELLSDNRTLFFFHMNYMDFHDEDYSSRGELVDVSDVLSDESYFSPHNEVDVLVEFYTVKDGVETVQGTITKTVSFDVSLCDPESDGHIESGCNISSYDHVVAHVVSTGEELIDRNISIDYTIDLNYID